MSTAAAPVGKPINPLLARYLTALTKNPLRTKALTTATLCFLQEVLGSVLAGVPPKKQSPDASPLVKTLAQAHIDAKAVKMALYGFLVSAPLGHFLVRLLQRAFRGRTGLGARVGQILASNLLVAPIQTAAFLASMAVINGAKTVDDVLKTMKTGFFSVIRITWVVSPLSLSIAQGFIPVELWVPFFNAVQFVLGTFFNMHMKKLRAAAIAKEKERIKREIEEAEARNRRPSSPPSPLS
ncbi:hypothetical protein K523DRAFT_228430 [Schizophyllum commune Tattone D]|nr:hypothetical protein K523DRAFT_228430 [Schizophyllum commune Tattone D]